MKIRVKKELMKRNKIIGIAPVICCCSLKLDIRPQIKSSKRLTFSKKNAYCWNNRRLSVWEVPDILISNELLEDMRKLADLYDYFKLTGAGD